MVQMQKEVAELREQIRGLDDAASAQLREISSEWPSNRDALVPALTNLYFKFAYLGRWSSQLDELTFQLSAT